MAGVLGNYVGERLSDKIKDYIDPEPEVEFIYLTEEELKELEEFDNIEENESEILENMEPELLSEQPMPEDYDPAEDSAAADADKSSTPIRDKVFDQLKKLTGVLFNDADAAEIESSERGSDHTAKSEDTNPSWLLMFKKATLGNDSEEVSAWQKGNREKLKNCATVSDGIHKGYETVNKPIQEFSDGIVNYLNNYADSYNQKLVQKKDIGLAGKTYLKAQNLGSRGAMILADAILPRSMNDISLALFFSRTGVRCAGMTANGVLWTYQSLKNKGLIRILDTKKIRFSQSSVNEVQELVSSMKKMAGSSLRDQSKLSA
jgi:hypothetical protein